MTPAESRQSVSFTWLAFLFSACMAYGISVALRLIELPLWDNPVFQIAGEPLMATHDAYAWMAGAKGIGVWTGAPMSEFLRMLQSITGFSLGTINFWLPVFVAPLVILPLALLCTLWGRSEAAVLAGIVSASSFGFLYRTRIGYGDTDVVTLFLLLSFGTGLIFLLSGITPTIWKRGVCFKTSPKETFWIRSAGLGIIAWISHWVYPNGDVIIFSLCLLGFTVAGFLVQPEDRQKLFGGLALICGFWLGGWLGIFPVLLALLFTRGRFASFFSLHSGYWLIGIVFAILTFNGEIFRLIQDAGLRLLWYSRLVTTSEEVLTLPNRMMSVREAQTVDWPTLMSRTSIHWSFFLAGICGYILLIRKHPLSLVFLPMLALAIFSFKLGNRFTMFGGPVIGLGLGFLVSSILRRASTREWLPWFGQIAAALLVVSMIFSTAQRFRPSPILPQVYAQTFVDLRDTTPLDSQFWQWWDYGYAAQYFAERRTMDDGARQNGLFPLALVHTTTSQLQASQIMKFSAQTEEQQRMEKIHNGTKPINPGAKILYYHTDPLLPLKEMENPARAQVFVETLAKEQLSWPADLPPQYLIFSWENLKLALWISYFGNWNLETGKGVSGQISPLRGQLNIDMVNGTLQTGDSQVPLVELSMVSEQKTVSRSWDRKDGLFLVINQMNSEAYLMDRSIFESMMVQMLLGDPEEFTPYFELVEDRYPWVRAYLVK